MSRPIALMVGLGAVAFFTIFANSIPQVQKHFDEGVVVEAGISQEEMAVLGEQTFNGNGGCTVCHRIGSIGARAPDLAGIGSRAAEAFLLVPGVLFVFIFAVIVYLGPSARKVPLPRYPRLSRFLSAALGENVHLTFSPTRLFIVSSDAEPLIPRQRRPDGLNRLHVGPGGVGLAARSSALKGVPGGVTGEPRDRKE